MVHAAHAQAPGGAPSLSALVRATKAAVIAHDTSAMRRLVYWEGSDSTKRTETIRFLSYASTPVQRVETRPVPATTLVHFQFHGVPYETTLPPLGEVHVIFRTVKGSGGSMGVMYGIKDGRYYLVTSRPVAP